MRRRLSATRLRAVVAATAALALVASGCSRGAGQDGGDDTFTIKFSHVVTPSTPKGQAAEKFKEFAEENSDGRLEVEIYPNSELYGDKDELQALQSNSVQILAPSSAKFTTIAPELQVLDLPFLFDTVEDIPEVVSPDSAVGKAIYENEQLAAKKIKVLGLWDNGFKQLSSNTKMTKPADLDGMSFRIQPSDVIESQFAGWDADTTRMAFSEVYTALQQGVIDGAENPYSNLESQKMHTVQEHVTESNHGYLGYVMVINTDFLDSLPDDLQKVVLDAADEATTFNRSVAAEINADAKKTVEESGESEITVLTDEQRAAFKDAVVPSVWKEYEDLIGEDLIAELLERQED